jgi:hypothetical protein
MSDDEIRFVINGNVVSEQLAQQYLDRSRARGPKGPMSGMGPRWERALAEVRVERVQVRRG